MLVIKIFIHFLFLLKKNVNFHYTCMVASTQNLPPMYSKKSLCFENKFCLLFAGKYLQSILDFVVKFHPEFADTMWLNLKMYSIIRVLVCICFEFDFNGNVFVLWLNRRRVPSLECLPFQNKDTSLV